MLLLPVWDTAFLFLSKLENTGLLAHACNLRTWETETDQPGPLENLPKKQTNKKQKKLLLTISIPPPPRQTIV